jgi:hypothetical protein
MVVWSAGSLSRLWLGEQPGVKNVYGALTKVAMLQNTRRRKMMQTLLLSEVEMVRGKEKDNQS